jgi:hypothetical protein
VDAWSRLLLICCSLRFSCSSRIFRRRVCESNDAALSLVGSVEARLGTGIGMAAAAAGSAGGAGATGNPSPQYVHLIRCSATLLPHFSHDLTVGRCGDRCLRVAFSLCVTAGEDGLSLKWLPRAELGAVGDNFRALGVPEKLSLRMRSVLPRCRRRPSSRAPQIESR